MSLTDDFGLFDLLSKGDSELIDLRTTEGVRFSLPIAFVSSFHLENDPYWFLCLASESYPSANAVAVRAGLDEIKEVIDVI